MFKKLVVFLFLLGLISCNYDKKPKYIRTEKIKVLKAKKGMLTVSADVYFENLNDFGGKVSTDSIDVYLDNIKIGKVNTQAFDVPVRDTFAIPVTATFDVMKEAKQNAKSLGKPFLEVILNRKLSLSFKGAITFSKGSLFYTYELNQTNDIKF